jgi:hypothetical protein
VEQDGDDWQYGQRTGDDSQLLPRGLGFGEGQVREQC